MKEVVRMERVMQNSHMVVTFLHHGGAIEHGTVVVYQPHGSIVVWAAEYTRALHTLSPMCGCEAHCKLHMTC